MISAAELRELREATRRFVRASTPRGADEHEAAASAAPDRRVWTDMARRLGLQGVRVPEDLGGTGLDLEAELVVHEEMGRALHGGPFLPVVGQAVPGLLTLARDGRVRAMLTEIAAGTSVVVPADARWYDPQAAPPVLTGGGDEGTVTGVVPAVLAGAAADSWLVPAGAGGRTVLALVRSGTAGATAEPMTTIDLTRGFATLRLEDAAAVVLARDAEAERARDAMEAGGALALAAECVGVAAEALDLTVSHVKVREQFGQVIGAFQGVKHQLADLYVTLESARSALAFAARSAGADPPLRDAALAVARRRCGAAAFRIAGEAIHLHGGIGFTWEHPAHLYYRRAKTNQVLLDAGGRQAETITAGVAALYAR
ncbi:acyl-CoA dehydrogenase [Actinomadura sp. NBRC 104412]|uniref:acyl-CoA dehydrogenase family protein n=1 Tax=Actinomadura sp. NBRC 104412 TaxID=3032203 RepID=UPI0024A11E75|nr:acyl-CoA dehydrogenase family protein [Actinomadura sp. NBRC 104412]GLZ07545.1 acyl-CoA dehydrogenase [Actinomadura sp. NBRC 104412]